MSFSRILTLTFFMMLAVVAVKLSMNFFKSEELPQVADEDTEKEWAPRKSSKNIDPKRTPASEGRLAKEENSSPPSFSTRENGEYTEPESRVKSTVANNDPAFTAGGVPNKKDIPPISEPSDSQAKPTSQTKSSDSAKTFSYASPPTTDTTPENDPVPEDTESSGDDSGTSSDPAPELIVQLKTFFQSTELNGVFTIESQDFGKDSHSIGVTNFRSLNPGSAGAGLSCEDQIGGDHSTLSPTPEILMPSTDVSSFTPSTLVDVPLTAANLSYGENWLISWIMDSSLAIPVMVCRPTKITLYDFPFFDFLPSQRSMASGGVPEFSGGFTHLGFSESPTDVFRGPASTVLPTGEGLRNGWSRVFH